MYTKNVINLLLLLLTKLFLKMSRLDHKTEIYLNLQAMLNVNITKLFNITVRKSLVYYLKCYFFQYFALHYIHFSLINFLIGRFWL